MIRFWSSKCLDPSCMRSFNNSSCCSPPPEEKKSRYYVFDAETGNTSGSCWRPAISYCILPHPCCQDILQERVPNNMCLDMRVSHHKGLNKNKPWFTAFSTNSAVTWGSPSSYNLHPQDLAGVGKLNRNTWSPLAFFFSWCVNLLNDPLWLTPKCLGTHEPVVLRGPPPERHPSNTPSTAAILGHRGHRGAGPQQNPTMLGAGVHFATPAASLCWCPLWDKQMQLKIPRPSKCVMSDPLDVSCHERRGWPNGQLLFGGYSFPTCHSLLGTKNWCSKWRI